MGQPIDDINFEHIIGAELKKQMAVVVKDFDWGDCLNEWISDVVQQSLNSPAIRKRVSDAISKALASDEQILAKLVRDAIGMARKS